MAVLQGGGQNLPSPYVCYPKDSMWNRVKYKVETNKVKILILPGTTQMPKNRRNEVHLKVNLCFIVLEEIRFQLCFEYIQ